MAAAAAGRQRHIVLVRAPGSALQAEDPYVQALAGCGCDGVCVPVLGFATPPELAAGVAEAARRPEEHGGLVFTSQHGVRAFAAALPDAVGEEGQAARALWGARPVFVVGQRTQATVSELLPLCASVRGAGCGSARELATLICDQAAAASASGSDDGSNAPLARPLLFPCGDKRMPDLPARLLEHGVPLVELTAYRAELVADPPAAVAAVLAPETEAVVFFSPRGAKAVLPALVALRGKDDDEAAPPAPPAAFRVVAIGPTTAKAIEGLGLGLGPVLCCDAPSPAGLLRVLPPSTAGP